MSYETNKWATDDLITHEKLNNIEDGVTMALEKVVYGTGGAQVPSEGHHTVIWLNEGDPMPGNPTVTDVVYVKNGDDYIIYEWDGSAWAVRLDPRIGERVDTVIKEAKEYSDNLVIENNTEVNNTINEVKTEQENLQKGLDQLDTKAQDYADQALADARADIATTATDLTKKVQQETDDRVKAVSDANAHADNIVSTAKTDLTATIAQETSDRNAAVAALDTKAQGYATTAKNDAITAANASVAKEVTDRQKAITDLDKKTTDAVAQAKTDAQDAVNALQVGGRNWLLDSKTVHTVAGNNTANQVPSSLNYTFASGMNSGQMLTDWGVGAAVTTSYDWSVTGSTITGTFVPQFYPQPYAGFGPKITVSADNTSGHVEYTSRNANASWAGTTAKILSFRLDGFQGTLSISNIKLEQGTFATDYTQAPEDIKSDYIARDDSISQTFTQYTQTNDGKVIKAQSDATQALNEVSTKVSQTEYNAKTGDLDSKYTTVKQTVDTQTTDIADIKKTNTAQDSKINTIQSDVTGTKQSISDIQTEQASQSTKINTIQTSVDGTKQDIIDIQDANGVQDGQIASINTTVSGLDASFTSYKSTNDGKVNKAQADIIANTNAISTKVSQTTYDAKTNQLQTDLNTTTATANKATTDIVSIKSDNAKQDARMTTIESDANGTKTTVSNLQTDLGKANGSISTLQQRADGFDATVTKVNNLSVGGRNLFLNSKTLWNVANNGNGSTKVTFDDTTNMWHITAPAPVTAGRGIYFYQTANTSKPLVKGDKWAMSIDIKGTGMLREFGAEGSTNQTQPTGPIPSEWTRLSSTGTAVSTGAIIIYFGAGADTTQALDVYVKLPKLELGTMATDWTPAPEDVDSATAKAQLTADQATTSLNNYKTDADGRISKAQADIIVNANAITQKVSQSDYNAKTGDLTTKVNTAQSTADSATSTIGAYKTSNDARVASAESKITANATAITQKVSQTDYDQKTGELSGQISSVSQTAGEIIQSVSNVQTQVNTLSQVNLVNNSDFRPDLSGWAVQNPQAGTVTTGDYDYAGNVMVLNNTAGGMLRVNSVPITLTGTTTVSYTFNYYIFGLATDGAVYSQLTYLDSSMKEISGSYPGVINLATTPVGSWQKRTVSNLGLTPPTGATYIVFSFDVRGARTRAGINRPILVRGSTVGDYVPGQYVNNDKISTVSQTVDGISSIVSDPATGLTKRVQTAEGTLSQVTGADIPALQKATYWQSPVGYDLNTYLTQGSFFFRDTTARTNSPTTSTKWMYLTVDRNAQGDRVTQTVWYDTQTDAKITYRRQYAGTWGAWYANDNDSVATIAQTNGAIQTEISNRATGDTNTLTQAKDFTTSAITSSESGTKSLITQTSDAIIAQIGNTNLVTNSEFDPDNSGWYNIPATGAVVGSPIKTPISTYFKDVVNNSKGLAFGNGSPTWITSEPVPITPGAKVSLSIFAGRAFASTTATTMDFRLGMWDANKKFISSGFGPNPINGTTTVPIKTYKVENITVPSNTYYISMVFGHSGNGAGMEDSVYHPMINVGEKAFAYSPTFGTTSSATQLALLKDNWSIGIADNTGKLASGIAGDANAMAIVNPKVIINSPQTQITGKLTAAQIDTKELSAISAVLGNVSSGSITNPISGQRSGHSNATISGKTVIDAGGINMTADMLVGGSKVNSEQLQFSPDTGILFQWNNAQGNVVRSTTIDEYGLTVSSGGPFTAGFSEMGFDIGNNVGGNAQVGIGGVYSTEFQRYRQSFSGQNLEIKLDFVRQGNLVMVNTNIVTYGPTLQGDAALMSGGKIPVGFRPVFPVDMVLNANTSGGQQSGMVISLDIDGKVYKTGPAWGNVMRVMGHTMYMTFTVGPSTQNYTAVSDGYGNITP